MQRLEVSGAVRLIYTSLGVKGLKFLDFMQSDYEIIVSALGYKVAYKSGSLDGLPIEIVSVISF